MSSFSNSRRGGFAPRRGRGHWARSFPNQRPNDSPDIQKHPLGQLQDTVCISDLKAEHSEGLSNLTISDCQYVASYNWLSGQKCTLIVPGKPPQWTPPQATQRLQADSGNYFRDPNAARYPSYPLVPAVKAIFELNPEFETTSIDLFACGSTLGNLLRFVRGVDKPFRFGVEVIGDTIFFVRKQNDPKEVIEGIHGFGHTFPEAYTTWDNDVKGSETHQRIVQYSFGGIKCLIRFESDGYIKNGADKNADLKTKDVHSDNLDRALGEDELLGSLSSTTISHPMHDANHAQSDISIQRGGSEVSQDSIFDLKTRSGKYGKKIEMNDIYPLLWIKQIPNFIIAYHDGRGLFEDIHVENVEKEIQAWKTSNPDTVRRFYALVEKIMKYAKDDANGLLEVYYAGGRDLEIRKSGDGAHALPAELREKWVSSDAVSDAVSLGASDGGVDLFTLSYKEGSTMEGNATAGDSDSDGDDELDYTACSVEYCGLCGRCTY